MGQMRTLLRKFRTFEPAGHGLPGERFKHRHWFKTDVRDGIGYVTFIRPTKGFLTERQPRYGVRVAPKAARREVWSRPRDARKPTRVERDAQQ